MICETQRCNFAFTKIQSNGNDFVVLDRLAYNIPDKIIFANIDKFTDRHRGIGCDGVIIVDPPKEPDLDFSYRIINASGKEVGQCGNGAICFARYIRHKSYTNKAAIVVEVCGREMTLVLENCGRIITLNMGQPSFVAEDIPCTISHPEKWTEVEIGGHRMQVSAVSMGNPHVVTLVEDVDIFPVVEVGSAAQNSDIFPEQVNAAFMQIVNKNEIILRVFERGVGETMCCGSGACAAVVVGKTQGLLDSIVTVHSLGGEAVVTWQGDDDSVRYTSGAAIVFSGKLAIDINREQ